MEQLTIPGVSGHSGFPENPRRRSGRRDRMPASLPDEPTLLALAAGLADPAVGAPILRDLAVSLRRSGGDALGESIRGRIAEGGDPLGDAFCTVRSSPERRASGQTLTPPDIISAMLSWVGRQGNVVERVVDPGCGSGRFTIAALQRFPMATAVAVERDPRLALIAKANFDVLGLSSRVELIVADYRDVHLEPIVGTTLFVGNPPYVRHHDIDPARKAWYADTLKRLGHAHSQLAGLHLHFFLKTLELSRSGDLGCFITASEWLDVNYGQSLRDLLSDGLGGHDIFSVKPETLLFADALVSACITCFKPHQPSSRMAFREIASRDQLVDLKSGHTVDTEIARSERKWSLLVRNEIRSIPSGHVPLGEMFKVQRGQVTGMNRVWVAGSRAAALPSRFLFPAITDAQDIIRSKDHVIDVDCLRQVVDLPAKLDDLAAAERDAVAHFLAWAQTEGAAAGYIASHRKPWWRVGLKAPPPVVVTYMGRRAPVFARNSGARLINVAHGLYPLEPLAAGYLQRLIPWLNGNVSCSGGRMYGGGLIKFEPSEVMRIPIPLPALLMASGPD